MDPSLPENLSGSIPEELRAEAERWWLSLKDSDRHELASLCDARRERFLFESFSEATAPKVIGGKFLPQDNALSVADWGEDYFQHLLDHPELMIVYEPVRRAFYIGG